jgi:flagellar motility protein MotE (MotC chaperone)
MKLFVALVMAIFAFAATIAGALYLAGGFTQEGMQKLLGIEAPKPTETAPPSAEQIPEVVKALNERDKELTEREEALKTEEKRVEETRAQLAALRETLQGLVEEATKSLDQADSDKQQRLQNVANSLGAMAANEPIAAANVLESWMPKDAAIVLQLIDEEMRGEILSAMKPDRSAAILSAMKDVSAPAPTAQP